VPTSFEKDEPEHDGLVETYVPVRLTPTGPVQGMLEIYTGIDYIVARNNYIVFTFLAGALVILGGQFVALMFAARRARRIVDAEKRAGNARAADLETLAVELLNDEDAEKKKIATGLHEELAQTLSAIKVSLELGRERIASGKGNAAALQSTVPALQEAMQLVRSLAMRLWPFSLDDLGLLSTLSGFCDEFERLHSGIRIDQDIRLNEQDVPEPLKIVIYRIIESALRNFLRYGDAENVTLSLQRAERTIGLQIEGVATHSSYGRSARKSADPALSARFATLQERATLSGGTFAVERSELGTLNLVATWTV
jgi:signal transduction histidine kinase